MHYNLVKEINVLNEDFRRTNSDADNVWSQGADMQIEFCIVQVDPNGNAIDVAALKANVYLIQINDGEQTVTKKFIKK